MYVEREHKANTSHQRCSRVQLIVTVNADVHSMQLHYGVCMLMLM
jgi:hypothetical protein